MKFLLIPGNNSLSHVAKCLALNAELRARAHHALIAVSKKHAPLLDRLDMAHAVLPDIQEADHSVAPTWEWFRRPERIRTCIQAEIELMKSYRPDRVLGVFRFTAKAAAAALGIPYDALVCGCMMPDNKEILGFADSEKGADGQAQYLKNFFHFAGRKLSQAAATFGGAQIADARQMLVGDHTYLWDFPDFMPLSHRANRFHIGPLAWDHWPDAPGKVEIRRIGGRPLALLTFGTCCSHRQVANKLVNCLLDQGYNLMIAAGNQPELIKICSANGRVSVWPFAPLKQLLPHADLVVSHGGQMTLFESLQQGVPVVVMPFQPEQAHNGVCLERIGCGHRLVPGVAYKGDSNVYVDAFLNRTYQELRDTIETLVHHPDTAAHLARARQNLSRYGGAAMLADQMAQV